MPRGAVGIAWVCRFRFAFCVPPAKIEGDGHAGGAQFIGKTALDHGTGHDHASDGQGRYALFCGVATSALLDQAPFQDAYHRFEHCLEDALCTYAAAGDVGRQCDHGAGVFDVLEMLARQVGADDLRPYVGR